MNKIKISEKLALFNDHWKPRIIGELNGQLVKVVKLKGEFIWHSHENEDELFYVVKGLLKIEFRDRTIEIKENEFLIVPRGVEHKPIADEEVSVMIFEPISTLNTGNVRNQLTRENIERI